MSEHEPITRRIVIEIRWNRTTAMSIVSVGLLCAILVWIVASPSRLASSPPPPGVSISQSSVSNTPAQQAPSLPLSAMGSVPSVTPSVMSYQGRITVGAQPFTGVGQFKFAIVNKAGTAAYWSNDGTGKTAAPFLPVSAVSLNVSNGLFNVLLGDITLVNMTQPITPGIFSAPDRALRVWFNDGTHGFQLLAPDVILGSVPYAQNAETLGGKPQDFYARSAPTPKQIAMLKWYTAANTPQSIPVGGFPASVAYDGQNMWVANEFSSYVSVLRASDGFNVMNPTVASGGDFVVFDGTRIWVSHFSNPGRITVLRASDGTLSNTFTLGAALWGMAFDGTNMWVTSEGDNSVYVLRGSDGSISRTISVGAKPTGIAFDGANMWVVNQNSNNVSVLRASDGSRVMTSTVGGGAYGITFDGSNMWVANSSNNTMSVLRITDGFHVMTPTVGSTPVNSAFDGYRIWVANLSSNNATVLRASDGTVLQTVPAGSGPAGVGFDGAFMWVMNSGNGTVSKR